MKSQVRELFSFTDGERNGTIVLLVLIGMVSVIISLQGKFISLPKSDFSAFDKFLAAVELKKNSDSAFGKRNYADAENKSAQFPDVAEEAGQHSVFHTKELFNFDPNNLPADDWVRLGLSPAQARSVKNFESKGGKFKSKEDVKKLFVISAERYHELEPYIVLPEKPAYDNSGNYTASNNQTKPENQRPMPAIIELNTADSTDLLAVKGIGPVFAKRILAYRERLGGYYSTNQLLEVFGMDAEKFAEIKNLVKADSSYIRKININAATSSDFKTLPYISPGIANALVNYRKSHGQFKSVAEICGCVLVNADLYRKIVPYLTI